MRRRGVDCSAVNQQSATSNQQPATSNDQGHPSSHVTGWTNGLLTEGLRYGDWWHDEMNEGGVEPPPSPFQTRTERKSSTDDLGSRYDMIHGTLTIGYGNDHVLWRLHVPRTESDWTLL